MKGGATLLEFLNTIEYAAFLLDGEDNVRHCNPCAHSLLLRYAGDAKADGHGELRVPDSARWLLSRVALDAKGVGELRISAERPIICYKRDLGRTADNGLAGLLIAIDLNVPIAPSFNLLRRYFGLTRAEAELAVAIATGTSLKGIASRQQITHETARTHLRSVLTKTHTHRQTELIALLSRLAAIPYNLDQELTTQSRPIARPGVTVLWPLADEP